MNIETWNMLEEHFRKWPQAKATPVDHVEFDSTISVAKGQLDAGYRDFVLKYGGGLVRAHPIYGLRKPELMGTVGGESTVHGINKWFRGKNWPGIDEWLVFSMDQGGNPIGFNTDGSVWLSDQLDFGQIIKIADDFEDYLLKWCFKVRPVG